MSIDFSALKKLRNRLVWVVPHALGFVKTCGGRGGANLLGFTRYWSATTAMPLISLGGLVA
jgi:hypothetical protein